MIAARYRALLVDIEVIIDNHCRWCFPRRADRRLCGVGSKSFIIVLDTVSCTFAYNPKNFRAEYEAATNCFHGWAGSDR